MPRLAVALRAGLVSLGFDLVSGSDMLQVKTRMSQHDQIACTAWIEGHVNKLNSAACSTCVHIFKQIASTNAVLG